jgi:hypothetical protein
VDGSAFVSIAGLAAVVAAPVLLLSGVALALFFGGKGDRWGPVNDVLVAAALLLLAPAVLAVSDLAAEATGPWFPLVSFLSLAGIGLAAGGQLLLVAGRIELRTSFVTGGLGMLAMLPWAVGMILVAFTTAALSSLVGWLLVAVLVMIVLTSAAALRTRGVLLWALGGLLCVIVSIWLVALGGDLLGRSG